MRRRLLSLLVVLGLAGVLLVGGWVLLTQEPRALPAPAPTATPFDPPLARVDGHEITVNVWAEQYLLDRVISQLAGQPAPAPRATLDRLIHEALALAAYPQPRPSDAEVAARVAALQAAWDVDAATLDARLAEVGLSRARFEATVRRLLAVEAAQEQITAEHDLAQWITDARAAADLWINEPLFAEAKQQVGE